MEELKSSQEGLLCPIDHDLMWDPVTAPCGHNFHRPAIAAWLRFKNTCPTCRRTLSLRDISENPPLLAKVREYARENGLEQPLVTPPYLDLAPRLLEAAREGDHEYVDALLAAGANPDVRDEYNWTPLFAAAYWGHKIVVEYLLLAGADVDARVGENQWTALHMAAAKGHSSIVELLVRVDIGADIEAKDVFRKTPLDMAVLRDHEDIADILRENGARDHLCVIC